MTQLDQIFGKAGDTAIDPVCKMVVNTAAPGGGTAQFEGAIYYFCGPGCNTAFVADPQRYLGSDEPNASHMGHEHGAAHDHDAHAGHDHGTHDPYAGQDHHVHESAAGVETATCYPCNGTVNKATAPHWAYNDTTFYFCSAGCEAKVKAEPERWLSVANARAAIEGAAHAHDHDEHDGGHGHH